MRGVLLALLLERPGHGGDLASRLLARLGDTWRVDTNDVYRLLEQLEQTGLAAAREEPMRSDERRRRLVYHPTDETCAALTLWMETRLPREPVRLALQAKLSVAREQDAPRLLAALEAYEHECRALAAGVVESDGRAPSWAALCLECSRGAVAAQLRAEADWAARTHRLIVGFLSEDEADGAGAPSDPLELPVT
jgi:DNA-binding PadR family transcriptional regulator